MRDGKLGAGARTLILKSCDLLLADALLPTRSFKNYTPRSSDSPLYSCTPSLLNHIHLQQHPQQPARDLAAPQDGEADRSRSDTSSATFVRDVVEEWPELSSHPSSQKNIAETERNDAWHDSLKHIDTDWSMRTMDLLFNASFTEFVKNEKNCDCTGRHLCRVIKEFKLDQVVLGLRWLVDGWPIENTARLLKTVFDDWLPELAALAVAQIGVNWPIRPKMSLIIAYMMMAEKVNVVALFLKSLTLGWAPSDVTDLISCLDSVLEWDDKFFNEFTEVFINELLEGRDRGETRGQDPEMMIKALASMYKSSISSTNFRIVMADLRLSVAKGNYLTHYNHYLGCSNCVSQLPCDFVEINRFPPPSVILRVTGGRNGEVLPGIESILESGNLGAVSAITPSTSLTEAAAAAAASAASRNYFSIDRRYYTPESVPEESDSWALDRDCGDSDEQDLTSMRPSVVESDMGSIWASTSSGLDAVDRWTADVDDENEIIDDSEDNEASYTPEEEDYEVDEDINDTVNQLISQTRRIMVPTSGPVAPPRRRFTPLPPIPRSNDSMPHAAGPLSGTTAVNSNSNSSSITYFSGSRRPMGVDVSNTFSDTTSSATFLPSDEPKSMLVSRSASTVSFDVNALADTESLFLSAALRSRESSC